MKKVYHLILFSICFSIVGFSQVTYPTSMKFTFSGGNNMGAAIGNCQTNKDIDIQYNTQEGVMNLTVNKLCNSWSFMQHWFGGSYAPRPVFKNRYLELRIKSTAPHDTGLKIHFQVSGGLPDGSINKSIPDIFYKINKENTWETKFFTLGGNADTVFKEIDYYFPNGSYTIDYVYYGDAAAPTTPSMDPVGDQIGKARGSLLSFGLYNLQIPGRTTDGLTIEAKSLNNTHFFDSVYASGNYVLYKISESSPLTSETILITLKDTIHNVSAAYNAKVSTFSLKLPDELSEIKIYPTQVTTLANIEFPEVVKARVQIIDITGKINSSIEVTDKMQETIDLSGYAQGIYFIKIFVGNNVTVKKILKL